MLVRELAVLAGRCNVEIVEKSDLAAVAGLLGGKNGGGSS